MTDPSELARRIWCEALDAYNTAPVGDMNTAAARVIDSYLPGPDDVEAMAKAHCDYFGGAGWWDSGLIADTKPKAFEAMRAAIAALRGEA